MTDFAQLGLKDNLLKALQQEGYTSPTPIQEQSIPHLLLGRDLLGLAQTGTGKTAAFALPILQRLSAENRRARTLSPLVLVLAPTRELASQIGESFGAYGRNMPFTRAVIFGGVGQHPQAEALRRGTDILVATPGRLLDLIDQKLCDLSRIETLVLDEADRMLDMGFVKDIRKLVAMMPKKRHTLLFSATMPKDIADLAASLLNDPVRVEVTPEAPTVDRIRQAVMFVNSSDKMHALDMLLRQPSVGRAIVFTMMKHEANKVAENLNRAGITADAIHGNKSQSNRERALAGFKSGAIKVLVATDIAARGIDVDDITHVINYDLPNIPESYVHRIGRTARAGREGWAVSLCDAEQRAWLKDIVRTIRKDIPVYRDHKFHSDAAANSTMAPPVLGGRGGKGRGQGQGRGHAGPGQGRSQHQGRSRAA